MNLRNNKPSLPSVDPMSPFTSKEVYYATSSMKNIMGGRIMGGIEMISVMSFLFYSSREY